MYKKDLLREYIKYSNLRIFKEIIRIRLSDDLLKNYDDWLYNNYLNSMYNSYQQLLSLNLKQPCNGIPNLYIYIVPDDNYSELLSYHDKYDKWIGWAKIVKCYDLDWYIQAHGVSQNLCLNYPENPLVSSKVNNIHELFHIICCQFANKWSTISEWLAESVPLYILNYENSFNRHKDAILSLAQEDIFTVTELFFSEKDNSFWTTSIGENRTCHFRYSYISSYLFVRWLLETITEIKWFSKVWALQYLLEFLKNSKNTYDWLIIDICNELWLNLDETINWRKLQNKAILSIKGNL